MRDKIVGFFELIGETTLIAIDVVRRLLRPPYEVDETLRQMAFVGVSTVPIVIMTSLFSGAVLALYSAQFLTRYGGTMFVGATVALSVAREIGPVLAGIMVSARCGSSMAAQIGSMAVTEQIDALKMLSVHPTNYLIIPRVMASLIMVPVLGIIGVYSGIVGGWAVAILHNVPHSTYLVSIQQYVTTWDFVGGILKTPFFGLIISLVACQQGMRTKEGAIGVGRATTQSVVYSMVLVYLANFLLAQLIFR